MSEPDLAYAGLCLLVFLEMIVIFVLAHQREQAERAREAWIKGHDWLDKYAQGENIDFDRATSLRIVADLLPAKYGPEQLREAAKVHEDIWTHKKAQSRRGGA